MWRSAQRMYIRMSISAKSAASTPPASERMVTSASRESYSPDSRVRTSSSSIALRRLSSSRSVSAVVASSPSSAAISCISADVVEPAAQLLDPAQVALQVGELGGDGLRGLDVVPEVGRGRLLLQLGDLPAQPVDVEHGLDRGQGRVQLVQDGGEVSGHIDPG